MGIRELIASGFLAPLVSRAGRTKADTSDLPVRAGEFIASEVEAVMDEDKLVEAACREVVELTADRRSVLIFAAGVAHGRNIQHVLQSQRQVECGFVCGETPGGERSELLPRFRNDDDGLFESPPLKYLCNVNVLTTVFDAPQVDCVALLRPTMSPGLLMQWLDAGSAAHQTRRIVWCWTTVETSSATARSTSCG